MPNILEHAAQAKTFEDIRKAIAEVGGEAPNHLCEVGKCVREQLVAGPKAVVNATIISGKGIRVSPIERKGYKIAANGEAPLTISVGDIEAGTSVQDALAQVVNKLIPTTAKETRKAPVIVGIELVKIPFDGCDYYDNKAYGTCGVGRKTGLIPDSWYLKFVLFSQVEPVYVACGPMLADLRLSILDEVKHLIGGGTPDIKPQNKKDSNPGHCPLCPTPAPEVKLEEKQEQQCQCEGPWEIITPEQESSCDSCSCDTCTCEPKLDTNYIIQSIN